MEIVFQLLGGGAVGAMLGWLIGRARSCSSGACDPSNRPSRFRLVFSILAGAVFGAAVVWWAMGR